MRNWNKKTASARTAPRGFTDAKRPEIALREKRCWEGGCGTGIKKQHLPGQRPRGFTDAKRPEIALREKKVLGGRMRNWNKKTASARTAPQRIYGRKAAGNRSARKKGAGRADAELE